MAASLGALLPPPENIAIFRAFRAKLFTVDDRENSCPLKTKVRAYDTLPEVEQFNKIMRDIYKDFCVKKLRHHVEEAETQLRYAVIFATNQSLAHQDSVLLDSINEGVKGRLDIEAGVNKQLREMIGRNRAFP
ncbi:hypothetical protein ACEPPN_000492 [Leptodophora sp. 'Broadleaf-Isolate-01']